MATNVAIETRQDGSIVVDLSTRAAPPAGTSGKEGAGDGFDDNLLDALDTSSVNSIVEEVHQGVEADVQSRQQWVDNYNEGLTLLGLILEKPAQLNNNTSTVRHPLLSWAIIQGQALANGEMLPANGPVKVANEGSLPDMVAEALERDLNFYIKTTAKEYYPDTDRALWFLYYGGTIFKKVYRCPLRRRPVSETVYLPDLIVSNDATTLSQARRVTHQIEGYAKNRILQMQDAGWWADVPIPPPTQAPSKTWTAIARIVGINPTTTISADHTHTIREAYTWVDLERWGYKDPFGKDKLSGLELPYVLTYDRDSRQAYRLSRNWRQAEENGYLFARQRFAKWGMIPGIGYLDQGFLNLLGNTELAVTALERILVDAGIYSIFPGGVRRKGMRLESNEVRPAPGEFIEIDTGGDPISAAVMPLPFKGPAAEVLALLQHLEGLGDKMAGTATLQTKEGIKDVPVGTLMAAIEQSATVQIAIHKRLHNGQKDELMMLRDEFRDMGEPGYALLRQRDKDQPYTAEQLFSSSLIPASDPEMPAHIHRFMQATALESLSQANPDLYDRYRVQKRILQMGRINDPDEVLVPPPPAGSEGPDPAAMAMQMQMMIEQAELQIKADDIKGKQRIAESKLKLEQWVASQKIDMEVTRAEREAAAQAEADAARATADAAADQAKLDAEMDAETLRAAQEQEAEAERQRTELSKTAMQLESQEQIAAMHDQTTLIVEGIRADAAPTEKNPTKDKKSGP